MNKTKKWIIINMMPIFLSLFILLFLYFTNIVFLNYHVKTDVSDEMGNPFYFIGSVWLMIELFLFPFISVFSNLIIKARLRHLCIWIFTVLLSYIIFFLGYSLINEGVLITTDFATKLITIYLILFGFISTSIIGIITCTFNKYKYKTVS